MTERDKPGSGPTDDDGWGEAADHAAATDSVGVEPGKDASPPPATDATDAGELDDARAVIDDEPAPIETISSVDFDAELTSSTSDDPAPEPYVSSGSASQKYTPEPYTPPVYGDDDLQAAVGVEKDTKRATKPASKPGKSGKSGKTPKTKQPRKAVSDVLARDVDEPRVSRRTLILIILFTSVCVGVAILILLGTLNSKYYYFDCSAHEITARRGRSFPPWGKSKLDGPEWVPIVLPDNAECDSEKMSDRSELETKYFDALKKRAEAILESKRPEDVDLAEQQLMQALLLARPSERKTVRDQVERLRGDVEYWRARSELDATAVQLRAAADRFGDSAERKPRHISDAAVWAEFAARMAEELGLGPVPLRPDPVPGEPTGMGMPFGGERDGGVPMPTGPDAQPGVALPLESDAAPPPPDASVPTGGVLM